MSGDIRASIVEDRKRRIAAAGFSMGCEVPKQRSAPLIPFGQALLRSLSPVEGIGAYRPRFLIAEIKRRSPSKGAIAPTLSAVEQAGRYADAGCRSVSVLTEEDHFGGSLRDLIEVKRAYPGLAVLRKDFLFDERDMEISYRAGADAVLLIAGLFDAKRLAELHAAARSYGLAVLVEIHSAEDAAKAASFAPDFTGINCRDLVSFRVDPLIPLARRADVAWKTRLVYESGIACAEDARLAVSGGFDGILVGEALVRNPSLFGVLAGALDAESDATNDGFWLRLCAKKRPGSPLVKICGLTNEEDARLADSLGADILGFVFAPSPRRADPDLVRRLGDTKALKVGVVSLRRGEPLPEALAVLRAQGLLDAIQFHGDEDPAACSSLAFPYYKALGAASADEAKKIDEYRSPRVLLDARVGTQSGGTGTRVNDDAIRAAAAIKPLWLAGGLGPDNIREVVNAYRPELVDASSRLESAPGKKDPELLKRFFQEFKEAQCI